MSEEYMNDERELGWDDEIDNKQTFIDIPDGTYDFTVDHCEKAKAGGSGKYAGTNMATVYCVIHAQEGEPMIRTNIILHTNFKWKLAQFFICIGLMEDSPEATLKMQWAMTAGCRGKCRVVHKPNYNDATKQHLEIDEFLKPEPGAKRWGGGF